VSDVCTASGEVEESSMEVKLNTAAFIGPMFALICLNLVIITGNVMVIMAVFTHSKLRCMTTNKFIVSSINQSINQSVSQSVD